jgi:hypothetical protein
VSTIPFNIVGIHGTPELELIWKTNQTLAAAMEALTGAHIIQNVSGMIHVE